eukprot:gnl/TRDRNA2_/TRDRNA2_49492_c0_seq1.p1 gnl/TRDRNA2_/TRDRNA2_49492_c0~~gnl/TRDRNA2_/TRDRNA2_49492_c0_seq1.p1  ORF type:complete len:754 (+),score=209.99 gnl/TRDRNA2_/TRDRNA2_49492_c0_seq1:340-2262(+)
MALYGEIKGDQNQVLVYKQKIFNLNKAIETGKQSLAESKAIREKASKSFEEEQKAMRESKQNLEDSLKEVSGGVSFPLSRVQQAASFAQIAIQAMQPYVEMNNVVQRYVRSGRLQSFLALASRSQLELLQQPDLTAANPQLGFTREALQTLQAEVAKDLDAAERADMASNNAYLNLTASKNEELRWQTAEVLDLNQRKAELDLAITNDRRELFSIQKSYASAVLSQRDLELQKKQRVEDYHQRANKRKEETAGIDEAIRVLKWDMSTVATDDSETVNAPIPTFVQRSLVTATSEGGLLTPRPPQADRVLRLVQSLVQLDPRDTRLSSVALRVHMLFGPGSDFEPVISLLKETIRGMQAEQREDEELKVWCNDEWRKKSQAIEGVNNQKVDLQQQIEIYEESLRSAANETSQIDIYLQRIGKEREEAAKLRETEASEFQKNLVELFHIKEAIFKAIELLQKVYAKTPKLKEDAEMRAGLGFAQQPSLSITSEEPVPPREPAKQPPAHTPPEPRSSGNVAVEVLSKLIEEINGEMKELQQFEDEAKRDFAKVMADYAGDIGLKQSRLTELKSQQAKTLVARENADEDLDNAAEVAKSLQLQVEAVKARCNFIIENYSQRTLLRRREIASFTEGIRVLQEGLR